MVLISRSADVTQSTPYFDVYIRNPDGTSTEAFRSDPAWFHYAMDIDQAITQNDPIAHKMGDLPTASSQYWLDLEGGSEMGGKTFKLITTALLDSEINGLGTSFISEFAIQYVDENSVLRQLLFCPHVYSISPAQPIPSLSEWGVLLMSLCLATMALMHIRARRRSV